MVVSQSLKSKIQLKLTIVFLIMLVTVATAIKAVCAHAALVHTNALNQILELSKLQRGKTQTLGNLIYHTLVLRRVGGSVLLQVFENATYPNANAYIMMDCREALQLINQMISNL